MAGTEVSPDDHVALHEQAGTGMSLYRTAGAESADASRKTNRLPAAECALEHAGGSQDEIPFRGEISLGYRAGPYGNGAARLDVPFQKAAARARE